MYNKLLAVQMEIGSIKKDSTNPFFKSKYFDINSLLAEVKPVLNKHGLVLLQGLANLSGLQGESTLALNTTIVDAESADNITFTCPIPEAADAQKTGSAITYFRRYALQSLLALEAEDDDANASVPVKKAGKAVINPDKPPFGPGSDENEPSPIGTNFKI